MDTEKIQRLLDEGSKGVSVFAETNAGDRRGKTLETFARDLVGKGLSPAHQAPANRESFTGPFLAFSSEGESPRHYYQAFPSGKEWEPFLDLIKTLTSGKVSLSSDSLKTLKDLKEPHLIRVLITPSCPFCAQMVGFVNQLAAACPLITSWIVDVELFPEWIKRYQIKAVPATILGDEVFLAGVIKEKELMGWLEKLDSHDYSKQLYRNDLLEKRMGQAVERLKRRPQDLPVMADLLKAEEFGIKLGAMAVIEQLGEEVPDLQGPIFEALSPLLRETSDHLIGDVIYLLGQLHDPRKVPTLKTFLSHANPEVAEAAREGLSSGQTLTLSGDVTEGENQAKDSSERH
jgi:hypothetical protein